MGEIRMRSKLWLYPGVSGWHFVTLPRKQAHEIKSTNARVKRGWGSLPVVVTIGSTTWKTSIFPDSKSGSYVLPVKAEVRRAESIADGDFVELTLRVVP